MWKTGTLSYEEFENVLFDFLERARKVGDSWNLEYAKVWLEILYIKWPGRCEDVSKLNINVMPLNLFHCYKIYIHLRVTNLDV